MDRLHAMESFIAVVDSGSFSAAARLLGTGQPAVSKTIAQLEQHLGVRLLLRSSRRLTPTEAGLRFYERARRTVAEADQAELAARGAGASLSGPLRICAGVTFARLHILPNLQLFLDQHPDLNIDVVLDDRNIDMLEHGIDVALRMGGLNDSGMTARRIAQARRVVLGTPAYFARAGVPASPADLARHQSIVYAQGGGGAAWDFTQDGVEVPVLLVGKLRVNAAEGVRAAVLADMGLSIVSEWMFGPELRDGQVRCVLEDWNLPVIDLWAVYPGGRMASAKARAFIDFVGQVLQAPAARY